MKFLFGPRLDGAITEFRLWAPSAEKIDIIFPDRPPASLDKNDTGLWSARLEGSGPGTWYKFRIGDLEFPDPASRQ